MTRTGLAVLLTLGALARLEAQQRQEGHVRYDVRITRHGIRQAWGMSRNSLGRHSYAETTTVSQQGPSR